MKFTALKYETYSVKSTLYRNCCEDKDVCLCKDREWAFFFIRQLHPTLSGWGWVMNYSCNLSVSQRTSKRFCLWYKIMCNIWICEWWLRFFTIQYGFSGQQHDICRYHKVSIGFSIQFSSGACGRCETISAADLTQSVTEEAATCYFFCFWPWKRKTIHRWF